ncbi:hypothetical protein JCM9279_003352 [Rhodotorula babjevae]
MASYASLPAELVSRIASIVHEQDQAWSEVGFVRDEPPNDGDSDSDDDDSNARLWANQYGRGNVAGPATTKTFFRLNVLSQPLGNHVRHVDCRLDTPIQPVQAVSLACALQGLPNLSSIKVEGRFLEALDSNFKDDEAEGLAQALKDALGRITSLDVYYSAPADVLFALSHVNKNRLRRLVITWSHVAFLPRLDELAAILPSLEALVEVELGGVMVANIGQLQQHLRFPHARMLSISLDGFREPTYQAGLVLASRVGPLVEVLIFTNVSARDDPLPPATPERLLPALRVLRVIAYKTVDVNFLHLAKLPALAHLHVTVYGVESVFPVRLLDIEHLCPTLPRTLTVDYSSARPLVPSAPLLARCDKLGIRLVHRWRPLPRFEYAGDVMGDEAARVLAEREAEAASLERLFEWGAERARWLMRFGDGPGLVELSGAASRMRERFVIEHS